ncbi:hypothetical protein BJX63DRAFT_405558 [Aspergillus granulosus]|uniref:Uncharacterized protein n=1 Tax=Aspergillus granulosus TaxID=176169 RepID=A0ABR4H220_9EURO
MSKTFNCTQCNYCRRLCMTSGRYGSASSWTIAGALISLRSLMSSPWYYNAVSTLLSLLGRICCYYMESSVGGLLYSLILCFFTQVGSRQ